MKSDPFHPGDKVTLRPEWASLVCTVPKLVLGRVYCVERVNVAYGNAWLRLVGVRPDRRKCFDDRGPFSGAFQRTGEQGRTEAAQPVEAPPVAVPVYEVEMMTDARWCELCKMQKDATDLVRQGRDDEALALLTRILEHDEPLDWLESCRQIVADERGGKRKGGA